MNKKPIFRWIVGNCTKQGIEILCESVKRVTNIYEDFFEWYICWNNLSKYKLSVIEQLIEDLKPLEIKLYAQSFHDCCISHDYHCSPKKEGKYHWNGSAISGSIWRLCPVRLNNNVHEIIVDNDVVLLDRLPEIDTFLNSNRCMILQDDWPCYGRFSSLVKDKDKENGPYSSSILGLPPYINSNFDFQYSVFRIHDRKLSGDYSYNYLTHADERGLVAAALVSHNPDLIVIPNTSIINVNHTGSFLDYHVDRYQKIVKKSAKHLYSRAKFLDTLFSSEKKGYHFCQANRLTRHFAWEFYKNFRDKGFSLLCEFGNKELKTVAKKSYIEGWQGSLEMADNWSETYARNKLESAKEKVDGDSL